jgi:hypothetical protein
MGTAHDPHRYVTKFCVIGSDGLFLMIRADYDEQAAALLPFEYGQGAMHDVPFGMLERWEHEGLLLNLPPC